MRGHTPDLPFDIFHCIMNTLACLNDFDTLKACSMGCKELHPLCARHLFAKIRIGEDMDRRSCLAVDQVKDLMDRNPKLPTYIKHLKVYVKSAELDNPNFSIVLNHLQNVNTLLINGSGLRPPHTDIPETLQMSLERLICAPSLINLELEFIDNFPILWLLGTSTSLKNLTLTFAEIPEDRSRCIIFTPNAPVPQLHSFNVALAGPLYGGESLLTSKRPDGLPVISFSSLDSLTIDTTVGTEDTDIKRMYLGASSSLHSLWLRVFQVLNSHINNVEFFESIHPSSRKTLQHLKLDVTILEEGDDPYLGVHNELIRLALADCPLQTLGIDISLVRDYECFMLPQMWAKLDVLSNFTALREANLRVHICDVPTQEEADILVNQLSQVLQVAFAALLNEPNIKFHFSVDGIVRVQLQSPLDTVQIYI